MKQFLSLWAFGLALAGCAMQPALAPHAPQAPAHDARDVRNGSAGLAIPGITPDMLQARYWQARTPAVTSALTPDAVSALNTRQFAQDPSFHRLDALPEHLSGHDVNAMVQALSKRPTAIWVDAQGKALTPATIDGWMAQLAIDTIAEHVTPRWAVVATRADMRTFPTFERYYRDATGVRERIDRLQETALFVGTPVAVVHLSRDGHWGFAIAPNYRAWLRLETLAFTDRATALDYRERSTARIVVPNLQVGGLQLDMSARFPEHAGRLQLPQRNPDGSLRLVEVPVPASTWVRDALPARQDVLLSQAFKFLGERYGWGHADGARDCSGFVSDAYRSLGLELARNTGDQRESPVFPTQKFDDASTRAQKLEALAQAQPGDLLFIPGHVMMVVGHANGLTYIIHDTPGVTLGTGATRTHYPTDGVSVTPFETLRLGADRDYVDGLLAIQRVLPAPQ